MQLRLCWNDDGLVTATVVNFLLTVLGQVANQKHWSLLLVSSLHMPVWHDAMKPHALHLPDASISDIRKPAGPSMTEYVNTLKNKFV